MDQFLIIVHFIIRRQCAEVFFSKKAGWNNKYVVTKTGFLRFSKIFSNLYTLLEHFFYSNTTSQNFWNHCAKFLPGSQIINDSSSHKLHLDRFGSLRTNYCIAEILASHYKLENHDPYKGPSLYYFRIFWKFFWPTHLLTSFVSIDTVLNVIKKCRFPNSPTQPLCLRNIGMISMKSRGRRRKKVGKEKKPIVRWFILCTEGSGLKAIVNTGV